MLFKCRQSCVCGHVHSVADCAKFLIDLAEELVILYEHIYEIYGDIYAATNCFKIDAYEQGQSPTMLLHWSWLDDRHCHGYHGHLHYTVVV